MAECYCTFCINEGLTTATDQDRINRLTLVWKDHPWEYQLATMGPTEQNFYKPDAKRES